MLKCVLQVQCGHINLREHPMFLIKEGNTPVMNQCEFPLIVFRYPYNRQTHPKRHYDNQLATYMLIDVHSGNMGCQIFKGGIQN